MNEIKLFCFPYAGGSAAMYMKWAKRLNSGIRLIPIELAGRGKRFKDPPYSDFDQTLDDIYSQVTNQLKDTDNFMLYGHSMGSLLVYELAIKIKENLEREPLHIFLSGRYPPHIKKNEKFHLLPDNELIQEIAKYGGTPRELFEDRELLNIFLPIIRMDYCVMDTYEYTERKTKLNCNISVLNGREDKEVTISEAAQWREYTNGACSIYEFDGGHFFINDKTDDIISIINKTAMDENVVSVSFKNNGNYKNNII